MGAATTAGGQPGGKPAADHPGRGQHQQRHEQVDAASAAAVVRTHQPGRRHHGDEHDHRSPRQGPARRGGRRGANPPGRGGGPHRGHRDQADQHHPAGDPGGRTQRLLDGAGWPEPGHQVPRDQPAQGRTERGRQQLLEQPQPAHSQRRQADRGGVAQLPLAAPGRQQCHGQHRGQADRGRGPLDRAGPLTHRISRGLSRGHDPADAAGEPQRQRVLGRGRRRRRVVPAQQLDVVGRRPGRRQRHIGGQGRLDRPEDRVVHRLGEFLDRRDVADQQIGRQRLIFGVARGVALPQRPPRGVRGVGRQPALRVDGVDAGNRRLDLPGDPARAPSYSDRDLVTRSGADAGRHRLGQPQAARPGRGADRGQLVGRSADREQPGPLGLAAGAHGGTPEGRPGHLLTHRGAGQVGLGQVRDRSHVVDDGLLIEAARPGVGRQAHDGGVGLPGGERDLVAADLEGGVLRGLGEHRGGGAGRRQHEERADGQRRPGALPEPAQHRGTSKTIPCHDTPSAGLAPLSHLWSLPRAPVPRF